MNNYQRLMGSVFSGCAAVSPFYYTSLKYVHDSLVNAQDIPLYKSLESISAFLTGFTDPQRLTLTGTALAAISLVFLTFEIAKPITRGFAKIYGVRLEDSLENL